VNEARTIEYRHVWAAFGLLPFLVTWRLWTPQTDFPQIPFFAALTEVPGWIDWLAITVTIVSLLIGGFSSRESVWRRSMIVFAASTAVLMLLNQHRFQAWAYQFVIFAIIMANCRASVATRLMRWVVISIYIYSAVSKLDYQFLHSLGPQFLSTLTSFIGVTSSAWPESRQVWFAAAFPAGELLVGLGLIPQFTRRMAIVGAVSLHVMLLLILGPWGLSHELGVLTWNLFFIAQALTLFSDREVNDQPATDTSRLRVTECACYLLTGAVILFPASESYGYCDHWPAWELYAPRTSRAQIAFHESVVDRLPTAIQQQLSPRHESSDWRQLPADRWSLHALSTPIYPEDRFQIGIALALADRYRLGLGIHATQQSASDRWTGARTEQTYRGIDQLRDAQRGFRLNVKVRRR
jgi:hypothetical protein